MRTGLGSIRTVGTDGLDRVVRTFEEEWRLTEPVLERHWSQSRALGSISVLAALVKSDLRCRFAQGQRPAVAGYLVRFPELREYGDRVLSLIYEEFCLLEEQGERPDVSQFCDRYPTWHDSLASQLQYHDLLSRVVAPPTIAPRFPEPGEHFQEFLILRELGRGSAGRVYLARDESLGGREVALKVSPDSGHEPSTVGRLDHPHIVKVHSVVFQSESRLRGICMQYQSGLSLDDVMRRIDRSSKRITARTIRDILATPACNAETSGETFGDRSGWNGYPIQGTFCEGVAWIVASLARALAYAHSLKIWHRDVKPANMLLALRDGPQLLDFNLAHDPNSIDRIDAALRGGTLPYMAPEQLDAFRNPNSWDDVGPSADLFSLGLVLREFLTGQSPETPDSSLPLHKAIVAQLDLLATFRDAPRRLPPSVPRALEAITARCLACSPADRYPNALALAEDLQRFIDHRPLLIASNPSRRECLSNWSRRHRHGVSIGVVLCGLLMAACYRPVVRMLVPLEQRNAFRVAVCDVDENTRRVEAIATLGSLVNEYPNSPLARLYLGIAQYQDGDFTRAGESVAMALNDGHSRSEFREWSQGNRGLLDHLETLGSHFVTRKTVDLAKSAYEKALEIDPNRTKSKFGLAEALEYAGEFEAARDLYSQLITQFEDRGRTDELKPLAICFMSRARNGIKMVDHSQTPPNNAILLYQEALADLEHGWKVLPNIDPELIFAFGSIKVKALLGLARVLELSENVEEASHHREDARKIFLELKPGNPEEQREWGFLQVISSGK